MCRRVVCSSSCLIVALLASDGCGSRRPTVLPSANPADVTRMEIRYDAPRADVTLVVHPSDYIRILNLFDDGQVDANPARWVSFASISITFKGGRFTEIQVFNTYEAIGAYKVDNLAYYRGSADKTFADAMTACEKLGMTIGPRMD